MRLTLKQRYYCLLVLTVFIVCVILGLWYVSTHSMEVHRSQRQTTRWKRLDRKCYKLFYQMTAMSYNEVITGCHESKAWPAIVSTPTINAFIHELMSEYGFEFGPVFIGLTYNTKKGEFQWHDGTNFTFTDWGKNEPNFLEQEKCVEITDRSHKWNNIPCQTTTRRRYACELFAQTAIEKSSIREVTSDLVPDKKLSHGVFTDEMFEKALVSGHRKKRKGFLTIGIPTVYRPNSPWYLEDTLDSLIKHSSEADKQDMTIVIFLADLDVHQRRLLNKNILHYYQKYFDSGLIHTIEAPECFYPSFRQLKRTYNHSPTQVKWRAKQNFDYAYLMYYSNNISAYYLQLEDDVVTVDNYLGIIQSFMAEMVLKAEKSWFTHDWSCLEFSELGFIAKLFHSKEIIKLATLLTLFYNEQPNDVLFLHFNEIMLQFDRYLRKPTIFHHRGLQSSLVLKKEPLIDLFFDTNRTVDADSVLLPVKIRRKNNLYGPEQELWKERKRLIRKTYCNEK